MTDNPAAAQQVCRTLEQLGIAYQRHDHQSVTSCVEAAAQVRGVPGAANKSLLLQSRNGQRFLVIVPCAHRLDLQRLAEVVDCHRLSFASATELQRLLGVTPGSVSPFGLVNDRQREVRVIIHPDILQQPLCQFHPNDNRATLALATSDFLKFLAWTKHTPTILAVPQVVSNPTSLPLVSRGGNLR